MQAKVLFFLVSFFWALSPVLHAQVSFRAELNESQVAVGKRFTVEFKINRRGDNFRPPSFQGLQVLSGPNTSVSTYMDNSGTRFNLSYSYTLRATQTGQFQIGPAFIKVDGETYQTEPVRLKVVAQKNQPNDPYQRARASVFIRPLVSKTEVYVGEALYARYRLYFRDNIGNPTLLKEPEFNGYYREELELKRIETESENYQGKRYTAGDLRRFVLIPQQAGRLESGQLQAEIPVQINTGQRDFFGRPIGSVEEILIDAQFPPITVKPLPREGRPDNFSGAVGQFELKLNLSSQELSTDESLTVELEISGKGNIKFAEMPKIEFPPAFEAFEPENEDRISVGAAGMRGSRKLRYLLVPRHAGEYKIGPVEFHYFDPESQRYRSLRSESFNLKVEGGQLGGQMVGPSDANPETSAVELLKRDIHYIQLEPGPWYQRGQQFWGSAHFWFWWSLLILAPLALTGHYLWQQKRQGRSLGELRERKAGRRARRLLAGAKKALRQADSEGFYGHLDSALWGFFGDKLGLGASQWGKKELEEALGQAGVAEEDRATAKALLERCEMARYTGSAALPAAEDLRRAEQLITRLEGKL